MTVPETAYPTPEPEVVMLRKDELDTARVQLKRTRTQPKYKITNPSDVRVVVREMEDYDREFFKVIHLDLANQVIGIETISIGDIGSAIVSPREAAKGALLMSSANVIGVHNHPSGEVVFSNADKQVAQMLANAFNVFKIKMLDFIIVGRDKYLSFYNESMLPQPQELCTPGAGERIMETQTDAKTDACNAAIRAVMETLREYCGEPGVMDLEGMRIVVPREVYTVREDNGLTIEQKIQSVKGTSWAQNLTKNWLAKMLPYLVPGSDEYQRAYDTMIEKVSRGLVT